MGRPLTIGLRYKHQDAWVGGVYYVQNLVRAFGLLPGPTRPRLVIVGGDKAALEDLRQATGYADLDRLSRARIERGAARRWPWERRGEEIDLILMGSPPGLEDRGVQWIPDLQEHRFPQFFPPAELEDRYRRNDAWLSSHRHVMVSSEDVARDVERWYGRHGARVHVVRFASFAEPPPDAAARVAGFALPGRYFICPNQFWRHKNHATVLRALHLLGDRSVPPVAFTGREEDYRDPAHGPSVRALAAELGVEDRVRFLGFLPRADQLALIAGAAAVLQPSLCEGWSTVIEDAKALGRPVIASDLAVHREQLPGAADLFEPEDAAALAARLARYAAEGPPAPEIDYGAARLRFAADLRQAVEAVAEDFRRRRVPPLVVSR
jgi:glycosyltransferase involved in cell wall biosynthesis